MERYMEYVERYIEYMERYMGYNERYMERCNPKARHCLFVCVCKQTPMCCTLRQSENMEK